MQFLNANSMYDWKKNQRINKENWWDNHGKSWLSVYLFILLRKEKGRERRDIYRAFIFFKEN